MEKKPLVKPVKIVAPSKTGPETEKQKPLTTAEIEAKKDEWWKKHARQMRETKEKRKEMVSPNEPIEEPVLAADENEEEFYSSKEKQKRICKKHGLKHRKLRKAVEQAKRLIVTKLGAQIDNEYLIAIIELLTYGDI